MASRASRRRRKPKQLLVGSLHRHDRLPGIWSIRLIIFVSSLIDVDSDVVLNYLAGDGVGGGQRCTRSSEGGDRHTVSEPLFFFPSPPPFLPTLLPHEAHTSQNHVMVFLTYANSSLIYTQLRLAHRFQYRSHCVLAKRSFCCSAYQHRGSQPKSSHALRVRTFYSSHCNHVNNKHDERTLHGYELTYPTTCDSRRDDVPESLDFNNNKAHAAGESFTDVPGTTNTKGKTLAIIYTCKVCNTRSAKQFTEQAYKHGVVLVKCPGCQNHHLIADRLGWFEDRGEDGKGWDVEKLLAEVGENVKAVSGDDVLELTLDDIAGTKR